VKPEEYKPRLLQIKGKKKIHVTEVPLSRDSLNSGDVFILDLGTIIFSWIGKEVGVMEKSKGMQISEGIESERNGKAKTIVLSEGDHDERFWGPLGGEGPIKSAAEGGPDHEAAHGPKRLVKLSDATGAISFTEAPTFSRDQLHTDDVFIVDNGEEVFVWVGKGSSDNEKKHALGFASKYLESNKLSPFTPVSKVLEGQENKPFTKSF